MVSNKKFAMNLGSFISRLIFISLGYKIIFTRICFDIAILVLVQGVTKKDFGSVNKETLLHYLASKHYVQMLDRSHLPSTSCFLHLIAFENYHVTIATTTMLACLPQLNNNRLHYI
uniref:Uncharacterized protein n=1 Tax=Glossina brevipalpis TaxID=37001 RepID=A0A1A9WVG6_9MUSC